MADPARVRSRSQRRGPLRRAGLRIGPAPQHPQQPLRSALPAYRDRRRYPRRAGLPRSRCTRLQAASTCPGRRLIRPRRHGTSPRSRSASASPSARHTPKGCPVIPGGSARGVRCGASQGGGASAYWMYADVPTTRRGAVAVVARPPGIAGQPLHDAWPYITRWRARVTRSTEYGRRAACGSLAIRLLLHLRPARIHGVEGPGPVIGERDRRILVPAEPCPFHSGVPIGMVPERQGFR